MRGGQRGSFASVVSEVLAPTPVTLVVTAIVALSSSPELLAGLVWTALAWLFAGLIPYAVVLVGVRRGQLSGRHIPDRRQRLVPMALAGASLLVGMVLLVLVGASRDVVALLLSQVAGVAVGLAVTSRWKASIHMAGVAGAVTVLVVMFGTPALVAVPALALVGWSRVALGAHTWAQVCAGGLLGVVVGGGVFALAR
ncbi:MAG: hypothetical protein ACOYBU_10505 [Dermatophilaceae bacterium]